MSSHSTFLYSRTSKYLDLVHGRRRPEVISEQSPYSGGHQVIPVITWTYHPDLPGNRSLFPGNVPVGCSGCRPLSYFRIFYGSRSIVEYMTILYYRRLSELYRCFRISTHYSDPPYMVGSNKNPRIDTSVSYLLCTIL